MPWGRCGSFGLPVMECIKRIMDRMWSLLHPVYFYVMGNKNVNELSVRHLSERVEAGKTPGGKDEKRTSI